MRKVAALAVALCAGTIGTTQAATSLGIAERSGFLLGAALHCGVANDRIVQVGQRMMTVIAGDNEDAQAAATASKRFAEFFVATGTADEGKTTIRCDAVSAQFARLERHTRTITRAHGLVSLPATD